MRPLICDCVYLGKTWNLDFIISMACTFRITKVAQEMVLEEFAVVD